MKIINILAIISVFLFLVCISGLIVLTIVPDKTFTTTTTDSEKPAVNPNVDDVILPLTEDAGEDYIDKIYFLGDSTTYHFFKGGVDRSHLLVPPSERTLWLQSDILTVAVTESGLTITEALNEMHAEIVVITLGVNGAADFSKLEYTTYYKKLINAIKSECPSTTIVLQSVFPVTKEYSDNNRITNEIIDKMNEWVKEIAFDTSVKYLDTQSILKDSYGAQKIEYSENDGIHMNASAYEEILYYIRTHSIYE